MSITANYNRGINRAEGTWFPHQIAARAELEHDAEKCEAVFRKDHAKQQPRARTIHPNLIAI
jgi:hypothetical protein